MTNEDGVEGKCSAFSIDERRNLFLTAGHCIGTDLKLDGFQAAVVYTSKAHDLAVLVCFGVNMRALTPSTQTMQRGTPVATFGYGYGWIKIMLRSGEVAIPDIQINELGGERFLIANFTLVGGMSGGPMVDTDGRVVSINQLGDGFVGLGRTLDVIMAVTAPYWQHR